MLRSYRAQPLSAKTLSDLFHRVVDQTTQNSWMGQFILDFPFSEYCIYDIDDSASFYLDDIADDIKTRLSCGKKWDLESIEIINRYVVKGSTVLDLGAHIGTMTFPISQAVGSMGQVIAFEPQPKLFRELLLNVFLNQRENIRLFWAAAGASNGQIELADLMLTNESATSLLNPGNGKFVSLLKVDDMHLQNVSLMKIDVEWMEDAVLDGAKETILANRPTILIEICGGFELTSASDQIRNSILHTIQKIEDLKYTVQKAGSDYLALPKDLKI